MICHKDKTFCASSGTCITRDCSRWIDMGQYYELPIMVADFKDGESCPGYVNHPALTQLEAIFSA